jgi:GTP cyclohydrolase I
MTIDRRAAAHAIDAFLRAIGRSPEKEPDLVGTGDRVASAFLDDLCTGYDVDTRAHLRQGSMPAAPSGLVVLRDIPVTTMCPHHLLPASGRATVAVHVKTTMVGLGSIAALVDAHARRLTLQEAIGERVVADLEAVLDPNWVACRLLLTHGCMTLRGERALGSHVETVAIRGVSSSKAVAMVHAAIGVSR